MKIIAHRSGPTQYPEQTVSSARLALANGADMVELDTRFLKDGAIAVSHDADPQRVFGVSGRIGDMTAEQFLSLRHTADPAYGSHLFEHYLQCGISPLLLHVKEGGDKLPALLTVIEKYGYSGKVVLGLQTAADVWAVRASHPDAKILAFMPRAEEMDAFMDAGADIIRLWEDWFTDDSVRYIHNAGREVWIMANGTALGYTTPEKLARYRAVGVDGILLNDVTLAK